MHINLIMWSESNVGWENLEIMKDTNDRNDERKRINYLFIFIFMPCFSIYM